jgi:hypothetical protein
MEISYNFIFFNIIIISLSLIGIFYSKNKASKNKTSKNKANKNKKKMYKQMYKIIETKSGIDKDPYNRKIDYKVVKKFCSIADKININLETISDKEFDLIYKNYCEYLIEKYN